MKTAPLHHSTTPSLLTRPPSRMPDQHAAAIARFEAMANQHREALAAHFRETLTRAITNNGTRTR